ncbi:hypothetical protein CJ030_MR1G014161 [Morella rubra]|uniref:Uncharacterized protein n=1 Tax=Morella rubra TaxID=262757 RepID=A0A6A1WMR5_9ROSI|nr:hypothetical protein CJ030_MR1G014161 [Morella rubra]
MWNSLLLSKKKMKKRRKRKVKKLLPQPLLMKKKMFRPCFVLFMTKQGSCFRSLKNGTKKTCFIIFTSGSTVIVCSSASSLIYRRPVVIERVVRLRDFNDLEYEGQSIQSNFEQRGWTQFLESTGDVYVNLVRDFYAQVVTVDANVEELTIQILRDARSTSERDGLPHGLLISRMLVAAGVPILPDEKIRSPIGPLCRSTFSRSAAHLHRGGANVNDDVDPDEVAMDEGPPPRSHPTQRGGRSTFEVGQSSSSQVEHPPWMDTLLDEFTMRMDVRFKKIEEEIRELRKERDNA